MNLCAERHGPAGATDNAAHDRFLVKPVDIDTLVDTVGDLLDLTWTFAAGTVEVEVAVNAPVDDPPADLPADAHIHIERLRERVQIGHVRGIEAEIRALEATVGGNHALVVKLYGCLDRFDLSGLARLLEKV